MDSPKIRYAIFKKLEIVVVGNGLKEIMMRLGALVL